MKKKNNYKGPPKGVVKPDRFPKPIIGENPKIGSSMAMTYNDPTAPVKERPKTKEFIETDYTLPFSYLPYPNNWVEVGKNSSGKLYGPGPMPVSDHPMFQSAPLATKFYRKGDPPEQFFHLRKSPQGYLYLHCKKSCEFVRELTVDMHFTPIG